MFVVYLSFTNNSWSMSDGVLVHCFLGNLSYKLSELQSDWQPAVLLVCLSPSSHFPAVIIMKKWEEDRIPCILVKTWYEASCAEECVFQCGLTFTLLHVQTGSTVHYSLIMHSLCNANVVALFQMPTAFEHTCHSIIQFNSSQNVVSPPQRRFLFTALTRLCLYSLLRMWEENINK